LSKRVLILHGLGGSDFPHWQAQLSSDLIKENYIVSFPAFPSRDNPKLQEWKEFFKKRGRTFQTKYCSLSLFSKYFMVSYL